MVHAKSQSLPKCQSNFVGLEVSFFYKKPSRILKTTKEIGKKASQARKNMPCLYKLNHLFVEQHDSEEIMTSTPSSSDHHHHVSD